MDSHLFDFPLSARALTAIGNETARAVQGYFRQQQTTLFPSEDDPTFVPLADALRKQRWSDCEAAQLFRCYTRAISAGRSISLQVLTRWVLAHGPGTTADTLRECIEVDPPGEVEIHKVLSREGSQKVVFLASWRLAQREVVLKRLRHGSPERILNRELQLHPSTMGHPNIIETHVLGNKHGERFLIETRVRPLSDDWLANGLSEAANLLYDLARAVRYLHDNELVHGDIKPDNIGIKNDRFLLLDFGICRRAGEFSLASTPTGSLRTRAPELLLQGQYIEPLKTDVWALGATLFKALVGRFPLIGLDEVVPRISTAQERNEFECKLAERVQEWDSWITLDAIKPPLRSILAGMLEKDVTARLSSAELLRRIEANLPAFLRTSRRPLAPASRFSPHEDFEQIRAYLSAPGRLALLPQNRRQQLAERLREFDNLPGFSEIEHMEIMSMQDQLEASRS